eukprot:gene11366-biopygen9406
MQRRRRRQIKDKTEMKEIQRRRSRHVAGIAENTPGAAACTTLPPWPAVVGSLGNAQNGCCQRCWRHPRETKQ